MDKRPSMLPDIIESKVIFVAGEPGTGKSTFGAQSDWPENIAFCDADFSKSKTLHNEYQFGNYLDLLTQSNPENLVNRFEVFMRWIDEIKSGDYAVVVLDNISNIEDAAREWVKTQATQLEKRLVNANAKNIQRGTMGNDVSAASKVFDELFSMLHKHGVRLIIVLAHVSDAWSGSVKIPNKRRVKGFSHWTELSSASLIFTWGRDTDTPGLPAAIVMKDGLGETRVTATVEDIEAIRRGEITGHQSTRRLPERIKECTWQKIRSYITTPVDMKKLEPHQRLTNDEYFRYSVTLSSQQLAILKDQSATIEREKQEEEAMLAVQEELAKQQRIDGLVVQVEQLLIENATLTPQQLLEKVNSNGVQYTMPEVAQAKLRVKRE